MKIFFLFIMLATSTTLFYSPPKNIKRILNSGDGKSYKTAYKVFTVEEEYQLLNHFDLKSNMQML